MPQKHASARAFEARAQAALADLAERGRSRRCPRVEGREGVRYRLDGRSVTGFCSNDYLGLATRDPDGGAEAASGATASPLICGRSETHRRVEARIAALAGSEDAVLFPSAFQANLGLLPLVLRPDDRIGSDRLNHASLIDGLRLARAKVEILPHLQPPTAPASWWITESVYSMDGTRPSTDDLQAQLERGFVYLDDAHAFGLGPGGSGRGRELSRAPDITVIGLGKAIGRAGGAAAASAQVCDWIRSACRSFVFSTAPAPAYLEQVDAALAIAAGDEGDRRRAVLDAHATRVATRLERAHASHIVPLLAGPNAKALAWSQALLERGFHVQAIRPPTVPEHQARLRLTLSAAHSEAEVDALLDALEATARALDIPWPAPAPDPLPS